MVVGPLQGTSFNLYSFFEDKHVRLACAPEHRDFTFLNINEIVEACYITYAPTHTPQQHVQEHPERQQEAASPGKAMAGISVLGSVTAFVKYGKVQKDLHAL